MGCLEQYGVLRERAMRLKFSKDALEKELSSSELRKAQYERKLLDLRPSLLIQQTSVEVLRQLIDRFSREHIDRVAKLVTFAYHVIFYDRDYELEIEIGESRGVNEAEFFLVERVGDLVRRSSFRGVGGGIKAVTGLVLQLFNIRYFGQAWVLFADEAFSQLSSQYIPGLMDFINKLAQEKGFVLVLISQDPRFSPYAKKVYQVSRGQVTLSTVPMVGGLASDVD